MNIFSMMWETNFGKITLLYTVSVILLSVPAAIPGPTKPFFQSVQVLATLTYAVASWANHETEKAREKQAERAKLKRGDSGLWFGCCEVCGKIDKSKRGSYRPLTPEDYKYHGWKCNACLAEAKEALTFREAVKDA